MKIAHIADIHIRGISRHSEYREIFRAFAADCKEQRVEHIAVEGDIFHTKTQGITPEYIELLTWWLKLLADSTLPSLNGRPTVHLRLGNHDGNLVNSTRQDAVTPVVDALADPRIRLYKESGTYSFASGFSWCVFGIFDREGWKDVKPAVGDVNIACYHGGVAGARSETDWEIESELSVEFFNDFDFAFLGDIHRTQHLARRGGKPWISYPGTPVQQNYAESVDHCYLLWDIRTRDDFDVTERSLPNPRPFVTLEWHGTTTETLQHAGRLAPGSRCRVRSVEGLSQGDMTSVTLALREVCAPSEVIFKVDRPTTTTSVSTGDSSVHKADLRSPNVMMRLLREHHRDSAVSEAEWTAIELLVTSYLTTVGASEETARNVRWSLRHLSFDNMFPYGDGNVINFDSLRGITGIFGPNRSGKSSIVGTLMYSLFNTTDRGPIENMHVVNARKQHCRSRFVIGVNDVDYLIDRQTVKHENRKGVKSANTSLNVFRMLPDGELHDMCGEQRSDTEKVIKALIGTAKDFQLTSFAAQGDVERFIREGSTQRRLILARFLDIDVFEKIYEVAKEDAKGLRDLLRRMPAVDHAAEVQRLTVRLTELDTSLHQNELDRTDNELVADDVRSRLAAHTGFVPVTPGQLAAQVKLLEAARSRRAAADAEHASLKQDVARLDEAIVRLRAVKQLHDPIVLRARLVEVGALERAVVGLRHSLQAAQAGVERSARSLKTLSSVPCGDQFPTCRFIKDAHADKAGVDEQRMIVADLTTRLTDGEGSLALVAAEKINERLKKHESATELLSRAEVDIARARVQLDHVQGSFVSLDSEVDRELRRHEELANVQGDAENAEVVRLRARLDMLRDSSRALDETRVKHATARGRLQSDLEKHRQLAEERVRHEAQLRMYDIVMSACSKRGVPAAIVAAELPVINAEIARILHGIVDFTVELAAGDEGNAMDVHINYGDSCRLLELGSGMEKFVSAIAIRVALTNVSSLPKTDTFIIDEGFGSLDAAGREAAGRLLQSLKRYFKSIIVISHVDEIKDVADNVIEITKVEKDSLVTS